MGFSKQRRAGSEQKKKGVRTASTLPLRINDDRVGYFEPFSSERSTVCIIPPFR